MLNDVAIINASPFILLAKSGSIDLLPQLFKTVLMPEAVFAEIALGGDVASDIAFDARKAWLDIIDVPGHTDISVWNLGDGETEVLSKALSDKVHHVALIDDRMARKCAESFGLRTMGTAGIIVSAKRNGLLTAIRPVIQDLLENGLYISDDIIRTVYKEAGES
jgi:predicted nucleic acid-binding protein